MYCSPCRHLHDHPPLPKVTVKAREIVYQTQSPAKDEKPKPGIQEVGELKIDEGSRIKVEEEGEFECQEIAILVTARGKDCRCSVFLENMCSDPTHR